MDDYQDYSDYDDYDSGGDVFDEEDDYDDEFYGGEDGGEEEGEEIGEEEEENEDEEEAQGDEEEEEEGEGDQEEEEEEEEGEGDQEEEDAEDEMEDYEEEEGMTEIGEQYDDDEEIVEDQGVEIEDGAEEDLVEYEEEEEEEVEEELMEEEEEEDLLEEEDEVYGDEGSYEDDADYENEIAAWEPHYLPRRTARAPFPAISTPFLSGAEFPRPRFPYVESRFSDSSGDGGGLGSSGRDWRRNESGDGTTSSRPTDNNVIPSVGKVVVSRETDSSGSHDSSLTGFQGTNCPICFERWNGEGEHCVCCLPCGHLYGLSCIKMWLQRPNSQKCPQCNDTCELADVRRLYGLQLAITGAEELQQKVKCLEAKSASLELKDTDWLRKEAEWQKREADLQEQLNQHKEAKTELLKDTRESRDPVDDPEPVNALRHMKL